MTIYMLKCPDCHEDVVWLVPNTLIEFPDESEPQVGAICPVCGVLYPAYLVICGVAHDQEEAEDYFRFVWEE